MSEIQAITIIASILGLIATVLNLVAFVREKDKSHTRAGFLVLSVLTLGLAVLFFPRYAPESARRLQAALPQGASTQLAPWLNPTPSPTAAAPTASPTPVDQAPPLQGSCVIEIKRNLLGGIGSVVANFQFANLSSQELRVTAFHISITEKSGETPRVFDRVLSQPVSISGNATARSEFELDEEIRDRWVAWRDVEAPQRGRLELQWEAQDSQGHRYTVTARNG